MVWRANPAFDRFPEEATLVGRILSGFGEVEATVCRNAAHATLLGDIAMKALYGLRATSARIHTADRLMRPYFDLHGLGEGHNAAMAMANHCLKIRNQYAHCNWGDHHQAGLFFADLQKSADTEDFTNDWKHVDPAVLGRQFDYYGMTLELLEFIHHEMAVKLGQIQSHVWPRPTVPSQPPLHNPASQHVPPWLSGAEKARHLERAAESEQEGRQPERPPSVLKLTEEEWRAKQAKDARLAGRRAE